MFNILTQNNSYFKFTIQTSHHQNRLNICFHYKTSIIINKLPYYLDNTFIQYDLRKQSPVPNADIILNPGSCHQFDGRSNLTSQILSTSLISHKITQSTQLKTRILTYGQSITIQEALYNWTSKSNNDLQNKLKEKSSQVHEKYNQISNQTKTIKGDTSEEEKSIKQSILL